MSRILLGVTGGIAAYKARELVRLLVRAGTRCASSRPRTRSSSSRRSRSRRSRARRCATSSSSRERRVRDRAHRARRLGRGVRGRARDRERAREARAGHRRRSAHHGRARDARAARARARDEREHVPPPGDAGEPRPARASAARASSGPARASSPAAGRARGAWSSSTRSPRAIETCWAPADPARRGGAGHRRADRGADRPGARAHQPLVGQDGLRDRRGRRARAAPRWCWSRARPRSPTPHGVAADRRRDRRSRCATRCSARSRARPSWCSPPRSPTTRRRAPKTQEAQAREGGRAHARAGAQPRHPRRGRARSAAPACVVGFAAETDHVLENARGKLARKGCDLIVANDVSRSDIGFDVDRNEVVIVGPGPDELREIPAGPKSRGRARGSSSACSKCAADEACARTRAGRSACSALAAAVAGAPGTVSVDPRSTARSTRPSPTTSSSAIATAHAQGSVALVIELDTPGGLRRRRPRTSSPAILNAPLPGRRVRRRRAARGRRRRAPSSRWRGTSRRWRRARRSARRTR